MKIVVLGGYSTNPGDLDWSVLNRYGELVVYDKVSSKEEKTAAIADADIICMGEADLRRDDLSQAKKLKMVNILGTGYDAVDCEYAGGRGIYVCNVPSYGTMSVAQYAMSLLLEICGNVGFFSQGTREGKWQEYKEKGYDERPLIELDGKTMGIIGFGRIGQSVGRMAAAFGMEVLAYNRSQNESGRKIGEYVSLDELLRRSDVISLHCPLSEETYGLINRSTISKMKDGVIIINNGRGPLIDEAALSEALNSGKVYAAGLDVTPVEPIPDSSPLLHARNCFITPHISWQPRESRQRILDCTVKNIESFLSGCPVNVVNGAALTSRT